MEKAIRTVHVIGAAISQCGKLTRDPRFSGRRYDPAEILWDATNHPSRMISEAAEHVIFRLDEILADLSKAAARSPETLSLGDGSFFFIARVLDALLHQRSGGHADALPADELGLLDPFQSSSRNHMRAAVMRVRELCDQRAREADIP